MEVGIISIPPAAVADVEEGDKLGEYALDIETLCLVGDDLDDGEDDEENDLVLFLLLSSLRFLALLELEPELGLLLLLRFASLSPRLRLASFLLGLTSCTASMFPSSCLNGMISMPTFFSDKLAPEAVEDRTGVIETEGFNDAASASSFKGGFESEMRNVDKCMYKNSKEIIKLNLHILLSFASAFLL